MKDLNEFNLRRAVQLLDERSGGKDGVVLHINVSLFSEAQEFIAKGLVSRLVTMGNDGWSLSRNGVGVNGNT